MKWVISGGTGFIGAKLVESLRARREPPSIVVFSRKSKPTNDASLRVVAWTPEEEGPWMDEIAGADVVVHLAGAGVMDERWSPSRKEEIRSSRVKSTALMSRAIVRARATNGGRPSVFVSASAVGWYGTRKDDVICTEDTPPAHDFLASVCVDWEAAAEPAREAGVRVVHPRIGIVFGADGGALARMVPPFKAFVGGPVGDGMQWSSWVHAVDVVRAIEFAAENKAITGPFNVTAPQPATMNEVAKTIGAVLHRPSVFRVPAFALRAAFGAEMADVLLTGPRAIPKALVEAGFTFQFPELRAALENCLSS